MTIFRSVVCHTQVLSETVATVLEKTGGDEVQETVKFVRMMDRFFDCLNVNNLVTGKHKRKQFQEPYRVNKDPSKEDFRLKVNFCKLAIS